MCIFMFIIHILYVYYLYICEILIDFLDTVKASRNLQV